MGDAIIVEGLCKSYGKVQALRDVSFSVRKGEIFGLLGPNGAGKTTLTNILAGVLTKDSGTIRFLGKDFDTHPTELKGRMNVVAATTSLSGALTMRQNLRVFGRLYGVKRLEERIDELLTLFGIAHLSAKESGHLSTGEKARLLLCKGLLNKPEVLLMDECTLGLDPDIALRTRQVILDVQRDSRTTVLFTSHNMTEVEALCNRIAFLGRGRILLQGTTSDIRRRATLQKVRLWFSGPKARVAGFLAAKGIAAQFPEGGLVEFELRDMEDELAAVIEPLFKVVRVRDLHIVKPRLEDVFLSLVKEGR